MIKINVDGQVVDLPTLKGCDGKDGADGVGITNAEINIQGELVLTYSNGNSDNIGNVVGEKGDNGVNGNDGISCNHSFDGTVLTVTSASGTTSADLKGDKGDTGANGYTPIKGTDYFTEADKAEMIDILQDTCIIKNQGAANVGKILMVGTDGNLVLIDMPEGGVSGDVTGVLDKSNNILLTGNLANGTYTLKYENSDGSYTDIGTLEVNTIEDDPVPPDYTNLAEPNETNTTDWSIWINDARSGSDGGYRELAGTVVSNYIPYDTSTSDNHQLRVKGMTSIRIIMYDATKAFRSISESSNTNGLFSVVDGDYTQWASQYGNVCYVRVEGKLSGTVNDVIITVDEEIV